MVRLTEAGTELIRAAFEDHKQAMEVAVAGVVKKDREMLIDLLRRLGLGAAKSLEELPKKSVAAKSGRKRSREE